MKLILVLIFLSSLSFASEINQHKIKILEKVITEISINKNTKVWTDNKAILDELKHRKKLEVTDNCQDATIIILENKRNLSKECNTRHIFALSYNLLSELPQSFGALFWKKGRPNIVILEPRIRAQSIKISKSLSPYLEEKIW